MKKTVVLGALATLVLAGGVAVPAMALPVPAEPIQGETGGATDPEADTGASGGSSLGASDLCNDDQIDEALKQAAGCFDTKRADSVANMVIDIILSMVGVLAVGVMIYGGFLYLTSNGSTQKLEKAKHAIMYGLIGLVVCLLAFAIVSFVGRSIPV